MTTLPRDQVETVLAELIKEALERRESAHVPGLGTFTVRHKNSTLQRTEKGNMVLMPPTDEIVFSPSR